MKKSDIDIEIMAAIVLEMTDRIKLIMKMFPKDEEVNHLLRNLAACTIHLTFFMRDIVDYHEGKDKHLQLEDEKRFLDECGCKDE